MFAGVVPTDPVARARSMDFVGYHSTKWLNE